MNSLDISFEIDLTKAKQSIKNIDSINKVCTEILKEAKDDGAERYRFWYRRLKKLHPLVDFYLSGQFDSSKISDVTGEHILNLTPDTQTVDLKYYYEDIKVNGETKSHGLLPLPIRSSIRSKIPVDQLKMTENAYIEMNKAYSIIMSTFFLDESGEVGGDPNTWIITRNTAHQYYNTQDYLGFSVKLWLYDSQFKTLMGKYDQKLQLLDTVTPISEKISLKYENLAIIVEGKELLIDILGNKIIRLPSRVDKSIITPIPLNRQIGFFYDSSTLQDFSNIV